MKIKLLFEYFAALNVVMAVAFILAICFPMSGCSSNKSMETPYLITIDGTDIIVGETTLNTLYEAGYSILNPRGDFSDLEEVNADYELEANAAFNQLYVRKDDVNFAELTIITGEADAPASEAVIARVIVCGSDEISKVSFSGVAVSNLTVEMLKEYLPGAEIDELGDGDSLVRFIDQDLSIFIFCENGAPAEMEIRVFYDVTYSP